MNQNSIKRILFLLSIGLLLFPLFQNITNIISIPSLKGVFIEPTKPSLSYATWFSGDFQLLTDKYSQQKLSIRSFLVRIHNQLNYSLFDKMSSPNLLVGKDNYLFNKDILNSYYGDDVLKEELVYREFEKFKFVQDTLAKLNKHIVFIIAPSKPSFCIEYLPEKYDREKKLNNYDIYSKVLKNSGLNYIDFTSYLKRLKPQSPYLLFPPKGLHWSVYGSSLVTDSLMKYLEVKTQTHLTEYQWGEIHVGEAEGDDLDVENVLNFSFSLSAADLAYSKLSVKKRGDDSLKLISVSDSFYGMLYYTSMKELLPPSSEYWFYGRRIYANGANYKEDRYFTQIDLAEKVKESDVILILQNEANLYSLGFEFIDRLYRLFKEDVTLSSFDVEYYKYLKVKKEEIEANSDLVTKLKKDNPKANLDSLLTVEAIRSLENDIWTRKIRIAP